MRYIQTIAICGLIAILIIFSAEAKAGAIAGIKLCENIIIPSLLPILILTNTLLKSKCSLAFEQIFGKITHRLFKLPKCCATAIIFGLVSGYPSGAVLTSSLYNDGLITKQEAKRLMCFNFCGGGAFIITAVGTMTLNSTHAGIILFSSNILSSIIILVFTSIFAEKPQSKDVEKNEILNITDALISSVEASIKSILIMSTYIILFSTLINLIDLPSYIYPLIEITNGICKAKNPIPIEYCAFFLCFGGLCVHFQIIGILKQIDMSYPTFLLYRIGGAVLAFFITKGYLLLFPNEESVFSNLSTPTLQVTQINTGFGIIMIIGCAVLIYDIENRKIVV